MSLLDMVWYLIQLVMTVFVLGCAYELLELGDDDDDDMDGGILQPVYVTNR